MDLTVESLTAVGMVALRSDISVGLTPDQGKRIRYQAIAIVEMAESVPPRLLHAILDGQPEGIIQFHELSGVGSIGDEKRGGLMAGFTKAPFYGAAYVKRGLVKEVALMSRASTQPRVEYVCGLLQGASDDSSAQGRGLSSATTVYLQAPPQRPCLNQSTALTVGVRRTTVGLLLENLCLGGLWVGWVPKNTECFLSVTLCCGPLTTHTKTIFSPSFLYSSPHTLALSPTFLQG